MSTLKRFENKVAVITGSASGIGLQTAKHFAQEGAKIVLVDLHEDSLRKAADEISKSGTKVLIQTCDVSKSAQVKSTVESILAQFGSFDVLVNNAGVMIFKPLEDHTDQDWLKVLGVDLLGSFYFIREAFKHMKKGSSIVNVASIHAEETTALVAAYAAAKAALLSLTRSAAIEGKPKGIRVNAIMPGAIDTPMLWENPNIKAGLEVIQKGDVGKPEDIASTIAFLASDEAHFVQGASLRVDGGRLARL